MEENVLIRFIITQFEGIQTEFSNGATFFFTGNDHKFPFATLVTNDFHDTASNLNRAGVFRLNIGVSKATFQRLFEGKSDFDFSALDQIMPHPIYGMMFWICVLSPSENTLETVHGLLAEAYQLDRAKRTKE